MNAKWISTVSILANVTLLVLVVLLSIQNTDLKSRSNDPVESMIEIIHAGDTAKAFTVVRIDGMREYISFDSAQGKLLLFVFHTTCPGCLKNIANWNEIATSVSGVRTMGISLHEPRPTLDYVAQHKLNFDVYTILDKEFVRNYSIHMVPSTILTDKHGIVLKSWIGLMTLIKREELQTLLKRPS